MKPAYTNISIAISVNISSTGHYTGKLYYKHNGQQTMRYVDLSNGWVLSKPEAGLYEIKLPRYVMREMRALFIDLLTGTDAIYYEYDRDGEKRCSNLRYHRSESVTWIIECLRKDSAIA